MHTKNPTHRHKLCITAGSLLLFHQIHTIILTYSIIFGFNPLNSQYPWATDYKESCCPPPESHFLLTFNNHVSEFFFPCFSLKFFTSFILLLKVIRSPHRLYMFLCYDHWFQMSGSEFDWTQKRLFSCMLLLFVMTFSDTAWMTYIKAVCSFRNKQNANVST